MKLHLVSSLLGISLLVGIPVHAGLIEVPAATKADADSDGCTDLGYSYVTEESITLERAGSSSSISVPTGTTLWMADKCEDYIQVTYQGQSYIWRVRREG